MNEAEMSEPHRAYLSLGSNIQPEINLVKAIELLQNYGNLEQVSHAWESQSVGADGPNYLNACVVFAAAFSQAELKQKVLLPIEMELERQRSADKFAPRTIDIDIIIFDGQSCDDKYWDQAFVVVPLAEIDSGYQNPLTDESVYQTATRLRQSVWMEMRPEVLNHFHNRSSNGPN